MAFVMIATGTTSRSRVRTLPVRPLVALALAAGLALLGAGGGFGYWLGVPGSASPVPLALAEPAQSAPAPVTAARPFALEQLGVISARLFRLESEAAQLSRRLGAPKKDAAALPTARGEGASTTAVPPAVRSENGAKAEPAPLDPAVPRGGPLLPPRTEAAADAEALDAVDAQLARIELQMAGVAEVAAERSLALMRLPTRLPIAGAELVSAFGNRVDPFARRHAFHAGLDFAAQRGTPIASAGGGRVAFAGFKPDFGWVVEIDHGNGLATRYAHASQLLVRTGAVVVPGERIARVGSTGRSTGPHLHFEVLRAGGPVDPKRYLAGL